MVGKLVALVLCGPSGVGKTTILNGLLESVEELREPCSYQTRPLRKGDVRKIYIHLERFRDLEVQGKLLFVSGFNGVRYGTSFESVEEIKEDGCNLALDFALDNLHILDGLRKFGYLLKSIYLLPPNEAELYRRLIARDGDTEESKKRILIGLNEISMRRTHLNWSRISSEVVNARVENTIKLVSDFL